ncbi:LCP family protein [Nocardia arizonensis]|uniref:LCP family protein n=1 Tax=Nocardia arizonensis TaxID=1141647 RepID=UPI0009E92110|nr:LCP family protein [Nocardia arizonensis]
MDDDTTTRIPRIDRGERPPRRTARSGRARATGRMAGIAARVCAGGLSAVVLAGTAMGWATENGFDNGFLRSNAIGDDAPHSLDGDMNILLIGLDTRKDQDGSDLPAQILDQLHAGDGDEGGYNANTLILVHIPANMDKITAVSIPRDDYVAVTGIPGYTHAKIKETYGLKKAAVQDQLMAKGETDRAALEHAGREAGRASVIQAVRSLTGVPIDRFAEITLGGFYDVAKALGGVEVCLRNPVRDTEFSGADFPAGRQRLDPAQSLAFVRQRHGLTNGDLDRTHRQQAFLTAVASELRQAGTLTDVGKLSALMDVAHRNVVLSDGWNVTDFLRTVGSVESPEVEFRTLPVVRYDVINGQDVNIIDPAAVRREVRAAFGVSATSTTPTPTPTAPTPTAPTPTALTPTAPAPTALTPTPTAPATSNRSPASAPTSVVDVVAAGTTRAAAAVVSSAVTDRGYSRGSVTTAGADGTASAVYYGPDGSVEAGAIAEMLGGLPVIASPRVPTGRIEVVIAGDFVLPADISATTSTVTPTPAASATDSAPPTPNVGRPVDASISGDSIPCVN